MLVICCCITTYSKTFGIKRHIFMILKFLWIKNEFGLAGFSGPGSPTKLQSLQSSFRRIRFLPYSVIGGRSSSSQVVTPGLQLCRAAGHRQTFRSLPHAPLHRASHNMVPHLIRASDGVGNREYDSKVEVTVFWNFITEVTSHHFCYILFFPSSLGLRKC